MRTKQLEAYLQSYYEVDNSVAEALESGDKLRARQMVFESCEILSQKDKQRFLEIIEKHPES